MVGKANNGNEIGIKDAALLVLKKARKPLTVGEITAAIIKGGLYPFNTKSPANMVQKAIRRTTVGIDHSQTTGTPKMFVQVEGKKYAPNK